MRLAVLTVTLLLANTAIAASNPEINSNGFDATNKAEFSGNQTYTQNNYSNGDHFRIRDVDCPVPTMYFGGNGSYGDYQGHDPQQIGFAVGVQIPLFTGRCEDAANLEIRKMEWSLIDAKQAAILRQESHAMETAKLCAVMIKQGFKPPDAYCQDVEKITMSENMEAVFVK